MNDFYITRFSEEHVKEAAKIEKETFSEPWSSEAMLLLCSDEYPSLALVDQNGEVCGYIGSARALDELQIINVTVRSDKRRRGYASALLSAFDALCSELGIVSVSLEVRESNLAARTLYERFGYAAVGKRRRFYRSPAEDAVVMVKNFN